jgi:hypothetical protein
VIVNRHALAGKIRSQLDDVIIGNPREQSTHMVFDLLREHGRSQSTGSLRCVQLIGESHAGKSTIIETYARTHNTAEALARGEIPVFWVKTDANLTRKGMCENILETFEDYGWRAPPMWGSETALLRRIRANLKATKVQLLVLDDFHHVVHAETQKVAYSVAETIKGLLIKRVCPIVMVGVEAARRVLVNHQLKNRAEPTIELSKLDLNDRADATLYMEFLARFLTRIDELGAVKNAKTLLTPRVSFPVAEATDGLLGRACNLIKDAVVIAVTRGRDHLTIDDLAEATDHFLIQVGTQSAAERRQRNPFRHLGQISAAE